MMMHWSFFCHGLKSPGLPIYSTFMSFCVKRNQPIDPIVLTLKVAHPNTDPAPPANLFIRPKTKKDRSHHCDLPSN